MGNNSDMVWLLVLFVLLFLLLLLAVPIVVTVRVRAGVRGAARVTSAGAGIGAGSGAGATVPVATPLLGVLGLAPLRLRSGAFGSQSRFFCASAASWPLVREVFLLTKGTGTLAT